MVCEVQLYPVQVPAALYFPLEKEKEKQKIETRQGMQPIYEQRKAPAPCKTPPE